MVTCNFLSQGHDHTVWSLRKLGSECGLPEGLTEDVIEPFQSPEERARGSEASFHSGHTVLFMSSGDELRLKNTCSHKLICERNVR